MKKVTTLLFLLFAGLVSYSQTAETEPNDSFNSANYITKDNVKTGSTASGSDIDYFVSHLPTDGTLKIIIKATNTGIAAGWLLLNIFGGDQGQLASRYISGTSSIAAGATVYDTITLFGRGADSVFFRYSTNYTFSYEFKYEITDAGTNDIEPNNSFATATSITHHEVKSGHIKFAANGLSDDSDFYRTKTPADGTLKVYVSAINRAGTSAWLNLAIFGGNHGQIGNRYITGTSSIPADATVYDTITLYGRGVDSLFFQFSASAAFSYNLSYEIQNTSNGDVEPNGSLSEATSLNVKEVKSGHIKYAANSTTDDYDFYRTKTPADGTLKVYVSATNRAGTSAWLQLELFGGNHGQIGNRYISGTSAIPAGAAVYDTITLYGRGVDSVFFQFSASGAFSYNLSYEIQDISNGDPEPNGILPEALSISAKEVKSGHIKYAAHGALDEYDLYRTKTPADGTLKVYVSATNRAGTSSWLNLSIAGGNHGQIGNRYITGTSSIPAGYTVYDTITLYGIGMDSVFFQLSSSGAFSYNLSYEIQDISISDIEPNGSLNIATGITANEVNSGHINYFANGVYDSYDIYRSKTPADGTLKVYVSATNRAGTSGWLNLIMAGGNHLQIINKYISGITSIPAGATVYDTVTLSERVVDSLFFQFSSSGAFSYNLSFEVFGNTATEAYKVSAGNSLHIFPNPTNGAFTITFPGVVTKGLVEIYTVSGKRVHIEPASFASEKKMNIKNLSPGVYIVKLFDGEKYISQKISVE